MTRRLVVVIVAFAALAAAFGSTAGAKSTTKCALVPETVQAVGNPFNDSDYHLGVTATGTLDCEGSALHGRSFRLDQTTAIHGVHDDGEIYADPRGRVRGMGSSTLAIETPGGVRVVEFAHRLRGRWKLDRDDPNLAQVVFMLHGTSGDGEKFFLTERGTVDRLTGATTLSLTGSAELDWFFA